jgi:HemY protein
MIRIAVALFFVSLLIVVAISLQADPGSARLTWLGWRVDATAAAAVLGIGLLALMATIFWRAVIWLVEAPARGRRARAEVRRRQGLEALTRGYLETASGNGAEARRLAQRAAELSEETPQLVRLLAARAAEAAGDRVAAEAAYNAMLGFPEMRLAAYRGLMRVARAAGDETAALRHIEAAFAVPHTAPWAWRALLQAKLAGGDWPGALALTQSAQERKVVSPLIAERTRAALKTATAAQAEAAGDNEAGLELAQAAAKARPDLPAAAAIAARLLIAQGRGGRAAPLLEAAWKARPHPALWLAWRDLRTDETPRERATRLAALAALNPAARESRIVEVEQALLAGDAAAARAGAASFAAEPLTRRLASLMARAANLAGERDEARAWIARGAGAPEEADWTDIDPAGRAFVFTAADWGRYALAYGENGELLHPRHERGEAGISDLPDIPAAYADSAAFISAAETGEPFPPIVDDGGFGEALQPAEAPGASGWSPLGRSGRKARPET